VNLWFPAALALLLVLCMARVWTRQSCLGYQTVSLLAQAVVEHALTKTMDARKTFLVGKQMENKSIFNLGPNPKLGKPRPKTVG
jgi:hypothetical protein